MELGWIDYSEEARQRTLAVLAALQESTAIDELGIGIVRDAFADFFFPATSTLFTRAKYLFLVPYALRDMEREDNSAKTAAQLRKAYDDRERNLAIELIKANANDSTGIIGARSLRSDFTGHWVKRGPAIIYWAALRALGFCRKPDLGFDECFRLMAGRGVSTRRRATAEEVENGWNDDDAVFSSLWHVPDLSYADWHESRSILLTPDEAGFLSTQLGLKYPTSLYALLMRDSQALDVARQALGLVGDDQQLRNAEEAFPRFAAAMRPLVDETTATALTDAVAFSDFVYLCRVRYNAQLPTMAEAAEAEWQEQVVPQAAAYARALNVDRIYATRQIGGHVGAGPLYRFLKEAREAALHGDVPTLDECIRRRERSIKHGRAKIGKTEDLPDTWRGGRRLTYRFDVAASFALEVAQAGGAHA